MWELAVDGNQLGVMVLVLGAREDYVVAAPVTKTDHPDERRVCRSWIRFSFMAVMRPGT